ncbi:MAG: NUDIX hydrolase [Verrucomicrobia bacterium]|nr:MAG: NUDIX hydrolase [Verrucomicrobiota bacterium]
MAEFPFKISVLVFVGDGRGRQLLMERAKEPNKGAWSPIGGKLEMGAGESPFQCAVREVAEEIGLEISESDLHLFAMVSERAYEGSVNWLMFLFDCRKPLAELPPPMGEGRFGFFSEGEISALNIPRTDRTMLWQAWKKYSKSGFAAMRVDCGAKGELDFRVEEEIL